MDHIVSFLNQNNIETKNLEIGGTEYLYAIINKDKIVIFLDITSLHEIVELNNKLPLATKKLSVDLSDLVSNKPKGLNIEVPAFLWDLYIVGLHKVKDHQGFSQIEIDRTQRDHFVARKIIVEYETDDELQQKIQKEILPESQLNCVIDDIRTVVEIEISDITRDIPLSPSQEPPKNLNQIKNYLKEIETFIWNL